MVIQRKIYLSIFSIIVLAGSMIGFIIFYLVGGIQNDSQELIIQRTNLASLEAKIKNLEQIKNTYSDFKEKLKEMDSLFINPDVPVDFIGFLEKISKEDQLKTRISLMSSATTSKDVWPFVAFQITAEGSNSEILRFIQKIESAFYLAEIQNITLSQSEEQGKINAIFSLKVYAR